MTDPPGLRIRQAVRAVMISPDEHVLLARFEFADGTVWALPGGGIEAGEDDHRALRRELAEEIGLDDPAFGPHVWTRRHIIAFEDGQWDGQAERYYVVDTTSRFDVRPGLSWDQLRAERLHEFRWWPVADVESWVDQRRQWFAPRRLGSFLRALLDDGAPSTPIDVGV